jgi:hypothetical protein
MEKPPSFRYRRIGMELRRIREERGMTLGGARRLLDRSTGSLSSIENSQRIRVRDLEYILYRYGIDDPVFTEAMLELAREGRKSGWWHRHAGIILSPAEMDFISLEADARTIRTYEIIAIPGLMQTKSYARALMDSNEPKTPDESVQIRMTRQQILDKPDPPRISVIITEATLRQQVGGRDVMREQLDRLLEETARGHVDLRVIPFAAGAHAGFSGAFTIVEVGHRGKLTVVVVETPERMTYLEQDEDVRRISGRFDRLRDSALSRSDSRTLIDRIRSEL